ncbi:MAG: RNA polymerase sigma factor [Streptosporangiaceae bacterium]
MGAFTEFYDREHAGVVVFAMKCGASLQAAEDAMQEAFTEMWILVQAEKWAVIQNPAAWIRGVALRKYRRPRGRRRAGATIPVEDFHDKAAPGEDPSDLSAGTLMVLQALRSLPLVSYN